MREFLTAFDALLNEEKGFNYASVNTDLLGRVIWRAIDRKLVYLVQELIQQSLGAESDFH
jgi:CubicO group peptidase (beta-lactamase class C family)